MPIFAPVDKPLELDCEDAGVSVATGVGAVCREPVVAAGLIALVEAVCADISLRISWSELCHCTWITSATTVIDPSVALTLVKETPEGIVSLPTLEVKYTLLRVPEKKLAHQ